MYKNELEFSQIISNCLSKKGFLAKTEIDSGYGIADVVAMKVNTSNVKKRLGYSQLFPLVSESYFKVLNLIGEDIKSPVSVHDIILKTGISSNYVRAKILKTLTSERFVKKIGTDTYVKINGWAPLSKEIIAIESKLSNWDRGIMQASRYKTFADKVYLALPVNKVHLVDRKLLKFMNIGLITLEKNKLIFLINPVKQKTRILHSKQNYVCEYFWNDMLKAV